MTFKTCLVERVEEEEEEHRLRAFQNAEHQRPFATGIDNRMQCVGTDADELNHLNLGHVLFPPNVLAHLFAGTRQSIVGVHQTVDPGVQDGKEAYWFDGRENFV